MSTIQLSRFTYFEPESVPEAIQTLAEYGSRAQILAGGIDLFPRMRSGSIVADAIINISAVPGLEACCYEEGKGFSFGAMTRLIDLDRSRDLRKRYPAVQSAIHQITSVQSKYMGTAVGNLCLATPASDIAPALMAYDAVLTIAGAEGERSLPLCDFYLDYRKTALAEDEFVTRVFIPKPEPGTGAVFMNRVRTHADIAKITVVAAVRLEKGLCSKARIAIGAAAPTVVRAREAEVILAGKEPTEALLAEAAEAVRESIAPITDFRSTEEWRAEMARVLTKRALEKAFEAAKEVTK